MCGHETIVMQAYCTFFVFGHWVWSVSWLNAFQPISTTKGRGGSWRNQNLRPSGQLNFCRTRIVIGFWATVSSQCFACSFKTSGPLSPGQSLESAVPERNAAQSSRAPHIRVVRCGRWNVRLRRPGRRPRPQCQQCP